MKHWSEDWVSLCFIEENLECFEEAEQETQERLQVAVPDERRSRSAEEGQRDHWQKLGFLRKYRDNMN